MSVDGRIKRNQQCVGLHKQRFEAVTVRYESLKYSAGISRAGFKVTGITTDCFFQLRSV